MMKVQLTIFLMLTKSDLLLDILIIYIRIWFVSSIDLEVISIIMNK